MPTLNIGGRRVTVDDSFLKLSPEQQNATVDEIASSLPASSPAIDTAPPPAPGVDDAKGMVGSFASSALDAIPILGPAITAGTDRIAALGGSIGKGTSYSDELARIQGLQKQQQQANPVSSVAGGLTGAVLGTAPLIAAAPAAFGAGGGSMFMRSGASMLSGAGLGGADAAVRSEGDLEKIKSGALIGGATGLAAPAVAAGVGRVVEGVANRFRPAVVQTADEIKAASQAAYNTADQAGVKFSQPSFATAVKDTFDDVTKAGIDQTIHPKATAALNRLVSAAGSQPSLQEVELLRRVAQSAAKSIEADERRLGRMIIDKIDDYVAKAGPADVVAGDPQAGAAALSEARKLWAMKSKTELLAEAVEKAERRVASTGSGGNIDNAIRQNLRQIRDNPNKVRGFTQAEREALDAAINGGAGHNAARLLGKLSPSGNGLMMGLHALAGYGSGGMTIPLALAGAGAKAVSDRATKSNAKMLELLVRNGGVAPVSPYALPASQASQLMARALMNGTPLGANPRQPSLELRR